ncbi:hypothetical protein Droror1_Dr00004815 [Drosera rotundifolia]
MASNSKKQLVTMLLISTIFMLAMTSPIIASDCAKEEAAGAACIAYITGKVGSNASPSKECCGAITALVSSYHDNKAAEITSCKCLQTIGRKIPGVSIDKASACVADCGQKLPFPLGYDFNCNGIH